MSAGAALAVTAPEPGSEDAFDVAVRRTQAFARGRLAAATSRLSPTAWPHLTGTDLRWRTTGASARTSGFLPGSLWLAYQASADSAWRFRAQTWQSGLSGQASDTSTHDVGFKIHDSFGNGYRLTGNTPQTGIKAAASLATRYSSAVGAIRSWNSASSEIKVIVDNLMNLELLLWASKHGGQQTWRDIAVSHALVTARDHVRPDGSTYHVVVYDPGTGAVKARTTHQGHSASSTWARGRAWAMHGFTMIHGETQATRASSRLPGACRTGSSAICRPITSPTGISARRASPTHRETRPRRQSPHTGLSTGTTTCRRPSCGCAVSRPRAPRCRLPR